MITTSGMGSSSSSTNVTISTPMVKIGYTKSTQTEDSWLSEKKMLDEQNSGIICPTCNATVCPIGNSNMCDWLATQSPLNLLRRHQI